MRGDVKGPREDGAVCALKISGPPFPKGTGAERQPHSVEDMDEEDPGWTLPSSSSMLPGLHHHRPAHALAS